MKINQKITVHIVFIAILCSITLQGQLQELSDNLNGTYTMSAEGTTLTLILKHANTQKITGSLISNTGISYQIEGEVREGIAAGICSDNEGSVFFEAYKVDIELYLALIEPDASNMPNYDAVTYLSFVESASGNIENALPKSPVTSGNEIGDPAWGFKLIPPAGWTHQQALDGIILGHNTIAGIILVFPHMLKDMQGVQQELYKGIQEEGSYLSINGNLSTLENNILSGDYNGVMDGQQVKAKGFGTLSPYGGGAFVIAVSTPDKLGYEIVRDAQTIASDLIYEKINISGLTNHFAGKWVNFTTNTSTWIQLYPDGTYDEQYESSYSGDYDNDAGNWGAYGGESAKGRWTVQGNRDSGRIVVHMSNGNEIVYEYRVHEERGEKYYTEYWFNGKLYSKSRE